MGDEYEDKLVDLPALNLPSVPTVGYWGNGAPVLTSNPEYHPPPAPPPMLARNPPGSLPIVQINPDLYAQNPNVLPLERPNETTSYGATPVVTPKSLALDTSTSPVDVPPGGPMIGPSRPPPTTPAMLRPMMGVALDPTMGVPPELRAQHGGFYFPSGYSDRLNDTYAGSLMGELEGKPAKVTRAEYEKLRATYDRYRNSIPGLEQQATEAQLHGAGERMALEQSNYGAAADAMDAATRARAIAALHAQRIQEQQDKYAETYQAEQGKRAAEIDRLDNELATAKIDPDRAWKRKNVAESLFSVLALGLGGFAEGFSGGAVKNRAFEMMQAQIDRDIDAQKADIANQRETIAGKRSLYSMARERFQDAEMAAHYTKAQMWKQAEKAAQLYAGDAASKMTRAKAEEAASRFGEQKELAVIGLRTRAELLNQQAAAARAAAAIPHADKATPEMLSRYIPGLNAFASDKDTRDKIVKLQTDQQAIDRALARMQEIRANGSSGNPWSADRAEYEALQSFIVPRLNVMAGQGAISAEDAARVAKGLPDPALFSFDSNAVKAIETTRRLIKDSADQFIRNSVRVPAALDPAAPTPQGKYAPQYVIDPRVKPPAQVQFTVSDERLKHSAADAEGREQDEAIRSLSPRMRQFFNGLSAKGKSGFLKLQEKRARG